MLQDVQSFDGGRSVVLNVPRCFDYEIVRVYMAAFAGACVDRVKVEINLCETREMTTTALGFLLWLEDKLVRFNGTLVVKNSSDALAKLFRVAGVERFLEADSVFPAKAALAG